MAEEHQTNVTKHELYLLVSCTFFFMLLVELSVQSSGDIVIGAVFRNFLLLMLPAMWLTFWALALRERKRQPKKEEKAA